MTARPCLVCGETNFDEYYGPVCRAGHICITEFEALKEKLKQAESNIARPLTNEPPTVSQIFFFANGNYCAFDKKGEQIPEEQGSAWMKILQDKLDRGVIGPGTKLKMAGWEKPDGKDWTVREIIQSGRLEVPKSEVKG